MACAAAASCRGMRSNRAPRTNATSNCRLCTGEAKLDVPCRNAGLLTGALSQPASCCDLILAPVCLPLLAWSAWDLQEQSLEGGFHGAGIQPSHDCSPPCSLSLVHSVRCADPLGLSGTPAAQREGPSPQRPGRTAAQGSTLGSVSHCLAHAYALAVCMRALWEVPLRALPAQEIDFQVVMTAWAVRLPCSVWSPGQLSSVRMHTRTHCIPAHLQEAPN